MRARFLVAGAACAGAALFLSGALVPLRAGRSDDAPPPVTRAAPEDAVLPGGSGAGIEMLRARAEERPDDAGLAAQLGLAYLQRTRAAADPSALTRAETALRRSLELQRDGNLSAFVGMASLANARHDFSGSVQWSRRAIETNRYNAAAYGLLGDALFELGKLRRSEAAYQEMVSRRPDVASYVRASYALQHRGRTGAALRAMRLALRAAGPRGETAAWVRHQMGDIYAGLGRTARAAHHNRIGTEIAPGYVPPTVGLAEAAIARGRLRRALEIMEVAAAQLPSLEYTIKLADLYAAQGREEEADEQYGATAAKLAEYRAAGVLPDADFIVFYADHGLRPGAALREAFSIYRNRPTAATSDALAWMLHALGRERAAWTYARRAIAGRPADATVLFHAGMIRRSLGHGHAGEGLLRRALEVDPAFSVLQAPLARRILRGEGAETMAP